MSKALVESIYGLQQQANGDYELQASASVTNGLGQPFVAVSAFASAPSIDPHNPKWHQRIAQAVVDAAAALDPPSTVDEVLFADGDVVGV